MREMALGKLAELKEHAALWGEFCYGCLIPGHFEAGMVGRIRVLAKGEAK